MLDGTHDIASSAGDETAMSETVPAKPPVDCREMVEVGVCPASNETLVGFAGIERSGVGGAGTGTPIRVVWTAERLEPGVLTVVVPVLSVVQVRGGGRY